jgi:hypothetical protein
MNQSRLFALVVIVTVLLGFALGRWAPANGRYQLTTSNQGNAYRLDTRTGRTWHNLVSMDEWERMKEPRKPTE